MLAADSPWPVAVLRGAKVHYSSGVARKKGKVNKKFSAEWGEKKTEFRRQESGVKGKYSFRALEVWSSFPQLIVRE